MKLIRYTRVPLSQILLLVILIVFFFRSFPDLTYPLAPPGVPKLYL